MCKLTIKMTADIHLIECLKQTISPQGNVSCYLVENPVKSNLLLPFIESELFFWAIYHVMNHAGSK